MERDDRTGAVSSDQFTTPQTKPENLDEMWIQLSRTNTLCSRMCMNVASYIHYASHRQNSSINWHFFHGIIEAVLIWKLFLAN